MIGRLRLETQRANTNGDIWRKRKSQQKGDEILGRNVLVVVEARRVSGTAGRSPTDTRQDKLNGFTGNI